MNFAGVDTCYSDSKMLLAAFHGQVADRDHCITASSDDRTPGQRGLSAQLLHMVHMSTYTVEILYCNYTLQELSSNPKPYALNPLTSL